MPFVIIKIDVWASNKFRRINRDQIRDQNGNLVRKEGFFLAYLGQFIVEYGLEMNFRMMGSNLKKKLKSMIQ